ncbi:MAG: TetR family transcriptional regulator [Alphaproteobacteria bacterium]|nr:TetR family transcriptional regulator [Alphaproteobacteria bacterium]
MADRARRAATPDAGRIRLPDPTALEAGELSKSARTRTRIMEAAVECLAVTGYAGTTTTTVAQRAGLTRAAMLYHFPSRMALLEAVIYYVTRRRNEKYMAAMEGIPRGAGFYGAVIDKAWEQTGTSEFKAFSELAAAARTDMELAAIFGPAMAEYDRVRRQAAQELFPQEMIDKPWFNLRRDVARFLVEGLAQQQDALSFNADGRRQAILDFLKALETTEEGRALMARLARGTGGGRDRG